MHGPHWMMPGEVKTAAAVALLGLLLSAFVRPSKVGGIETAAEGTKRTKILITGMSCDHCARSVQRALMESAGVESAEVDHKRGFPVVTGVEFDREALKSAVESLGYSVSGFEEPTD